MSDAFERLYYTDCVPGQGKSGGGGFQIQAQSAGLDSTQTRMAVSELLYSAQPEWINANREPADFPRGLAHCAEPSYGTAQSAYIGTEANGARQGNYLSDCLITDDPELYGVIRPAQLWEADFWRDQPWESTECPTFDEGLDLGPLDSDALAEWMKDSPRRPMMVAQLATLLAQPDGTRVVIVSDTPEQALTWIAAATVLMPIGEALAVSFKVFGNNLNQSRHRVLAVPRELNPNIRPGRAAAMHVLDAVEEVADEVGASAAARDWVARFLEAGEPYDVIAAVDLVDDLKLPGISDADVRAVAWALCAEDEPVHDVEPLSGWLAAAGPALITEHGSPLAERIVSGATSVAGLRLVDRLAAEGLVEVDLAGVRFKLLEAEVTKAGMGEAPQEEQLPSITFDEERTRDAVSWLTSGIALGDDRDVNLLMQVAWRHRIDLRPLSVSMQSRIEQFVRSWLDYPAGGYYIEKWALVVEVAAELRAQLIERKQAGDLTVLKAVLPFVGDLLLAGGNLLEDPLIWDLESYTIATRRDQGPTLVARMIYQARGPFEVRRLTAYQEALVRWDALDGAAAVTLVAHLPKTVPLDRSILALALRALPAETKRPRTDTYDAIMALDRRGLLPNDRYLLDLRDAVQALRDLFLEAPKVRDPAQLKGMTKELKALSRADAKTVNAQMSSIVTIAIDSRVSELGAALILYLPQSSVQTFLNTWAKHLVDDKSPRAAVAAMGWMGITNVPATVCKTLEESIRNYASRMTDEQFAAWYTKLAAHASVDEEPVLQWMFPPVKQSARKHRNSKEKR